MNSQFCPTMHSRLTNYLPPGCSSSPHFGWHLLCISCFQLRKFSYGRETDALLIAATTRSKNGQALPRKVRPVRSDRGKGFL